MDDSKIGFCKEESESVGVCACVRKGACVLKGVCMGACAYERER